MHKKLPTRIVGSEGPAQYSYLENTSSRMAFWSCWLEKLGSNYFFCYKFGRIGSSGKSGHQKFNGYHAAYSALAAKRSEKMAGDYTVEFQDSAAFQEPEPKPILLGKGVPLNPEARLNRSVGVSPAVAKVVTPAPALELDPVQDALDMLADF